MILWLPYGSYYHLILASNIRGNVDLLEKENLVRNDNEWNDKIKLSTDREKINMSVFDKKNIEKQMIKVYIGDNRIITDTLKLLIIFSFLPL